MAQNIFPALWHYWKKADPRWRVGKVDEDDRQPGKAGGCAMMAEAMSRKPLVPGQFARLWAGMAGALPCGAGAVSGHADEPAAIAPPVEQ